MCRDTSLFTRTTDIGLFLYDLPPRYHGYDLFHSYKVVMNEPQPYLHFSDHRAKYDHFRGSPNGQVFIRDSHEDRYRDQSTA